MGDEWKGQVRGVWSGKVEVNQNSPYLMFSPPLPFQVVEGRRRVVRGRYVGSLAH